MKGDTRRGFLFIFVCFLVLWGEGVRGQCPNDSDDIPFQFVGEGEPCEIREQNGLYRMCQNYLACETQQDNKTVCVDGDLEKVSDYPYGKTCQPDTSDCPTPLQCLYDGLKAKYVCDYRNMPNGYACAKDAQCASKTCLVLNTGEYGTCSPPKHKKIPGEEEEGRWWGEEDEDSVGGGACKATWQCDEIQFCSLEGFCTSSLKQGQDCTLYKHLSMSQNNICEPGSFLPSSPPLPPLSPSPSFPFSSILPPSSSFLTKGLGCFPSSSSPSNVYSCQAISSAPAGEYCDGNTFFCRYSTYCSTETQFCTNYPSESPTDISCDSSVVGSCPLGQRCICEGVVSNTEDNTTNYVCADFMNSGCSRNLQTYYDCLSACYFDPFTLVNNEESSMPPEFLPPLNRFSCASMQCQKEYDLVVKCQNDKNIVNSLSGFSPIRSPGWASYYDPNFKGWQVALVVVACAVGVVMIVSFGILITTRNKRETYETIND